MAKGKDYSNCILFRSFSHWAYFIISGGYCSLDVANRYICYIMSHAFALLASLQTKLVVLIRVWSLNR